MRNHHVIVLVVALVTGVTDCPAMGRPGRAGRQAEQLNRAFAEAVAKVMPSVVVVTVKAKPEEKPSAEVLRKDDDPNDNLDADFWRRYREKFFEFPRERGIGRGSGLIIRKNGFILTNSHVVQEAESIHVRLKDGRTFTARIHSQDLLSDLAILKIDAADLPVAHFGDSARVKVGEFAIAIGAPYNFDFSATFGHISAKGRCNVLPASMGGAVMDQDYLQTDALISPGNSGGPLLNLRGDVIGINTLIQGIDTGIGFAIPSDMARTVSDQLVEAGKYSRSWIGVEVAVQTEVSKGKDAALCGVVITRVVPGGPAAASALQAGDIIQRIGGRTVSSPQELRQAVRRHRIGEELSLLIWREGRQIEVRVRAGELVGPQTGGGQPPPALPENGNANPNAVQSVSWGRCNCRLQFMAASVS